jgi:hypothetical protein
VIIVHDYEPNQHGVFSHFATRCYQNVESLDIANPEASEVSKVSLPREIDLLHMTVYFPESNSGFGVSSFLMLRVLDLSISELR